MKNTKKFNEVKGSIGKLIDEKLLEDLDLSKITQEKIKDEVATMLSRVSYIIEQVDFIEANHLAAAAVVAKRGG